MGGREGEIEEEGDNLAAELFGFDLGQVQDLPGAPPDQQTGRDGEDDLDDREKDGIGKDGIDIGIPVLAVDLVEFGVFPLLGGKACTICIPVMCSCTKAFRAATALRTG